MELDDLWSGEERICLDLRLSWRERGESDALKILIVLEK